MSQVVPFGKYKGQPVEAMAQDREYCEWLAAQDWFRTKFTAIHTLIVNNFTEPSETPEHNALQAMFTDEKWADRFLAICLGDSEMFAKAFIKARDSRINSAWDPWTEKEKAEALSIPIEIRCGLVKFEVDGADVVVYPKGAAAWVSNPLRIECKPALGDDYPAVLRQMKATKCFVLLIGSGGYTGVGATLEQVTKIFAASNIKIVHLADV